MDLISFLGVLVRRRFIVIPVLSSGLVLAALAWLSAAPTYQTTGTVLLRFPVGASEELARQNPYLGYGSLFVPGRVIADVVSSPEYAARMAEVGVAGTYAVQVDTTTQAPIIAIMSEAPTAQQAVATSVAVISELEKVLAARQVAAGAPPGTLVSAEVVDAPDQAVARNSSRIRATGALVALTVIVAASGALAGEALARRRAADPEVPEQPRSRELPCSLCAAWFPEDRLLLHLEVQHGLARAPRSAPAEPRAGSGATGVAPGSPAHARDGTRTGLRRTR